MRWEVIAYEKAYPGHEILVFIEKTWVERPYEKKVPKGPSIKYCQKEE